MTPDPTTTPGPGEPISGVTQTEFVEGPGSRGNCGQAVVATWFDVDLEDVPNFTEYGEWFWQMFSGYFAERGYLIEEVGLGSHDLPMERCMVVGDSPRGGGIKHIVIMEGGEITWDPHPSRDGLLSYGRAYIPRAKADLLAIVRHHDTKCAARIDAAEKDRDQFYDELVRRDGPEVDSALHRAERAEAENTRLRAEPTSPAAIEAVAQALYEWKVSTKWNGDLTHEDYIDGATDILAALDSHLKGEQ